MEDTPRSVTSIYTDFEGRRSALLRALTSDVQRFYDACDPNRENLVFHGDPAGVWSVDLPAEEVPPELPEPCLGINFARDGMQRSDWLALVAVHADSWLVSVAFYYGAKLDAAGRQQLFTAINRHPTLYETVTQRQPASNRRRTDPEPGGEARHAKAADRPLSTGRMLQRSDIVPQLRGRQAELFWPDDNLWYEVNLGAGSCLSLTASLLQLRGAEPVQPPLQDAAGNVLLFNGEVFGGLRVEGGQNDGIALLDVLAAEPPAEISQADHVTAALSALRGPWALVYWQASAHRLWFGRDSVGRRSLLVHYPDTTCCDLVITSVAPGCSSAAASAPQGTTGGLAWQELQPGLYSFEAGALAHKALPAGAPIDLACVCFDGGRSPDRLAAIDALSELAAVAPGRQWRLIEVDASLEDVERHRPRLLSLLHPADTVMDLNIGAALWLAAQAVGRVRLVPARPPSASSTSPGAVTGEAPLYWAGGVYRSAAHILLVGHGADEQCAGYGRHRSRFRTHRWEGLAAELAVDMARLWTRNLGRDDRLLADTGREARHPFLDERLQLALLETPLALLADLALPPGTGDKRLLRETLRALGLPRTAARPKRAIQFGSRLGRAANTMETRIIVWLYLLY
ncbi:hypothetical protein WJX81_000522 [Elliptochloris bilobata]|uniref:Glutamine amidotransferase type-2 domain-containing protein n=1 Tax=Elliptochloris bilobata TaxID=381761 RepID=A0AAW1RPP0_9CHLO